MDETKNTGLLGKVQGWLAQPFQSSGSALNWWLFVGLLFIAAFFWQVVLIDLAKEL